MPATVPFVGPKKRNDLSPRGKEDDNPDAGGAGWSVTGRSQWLERPETGAQDVVMAHEDQQTARSPTSSTQCWPGSSPAMASGFGCSNGWSREANCREGQNPTDEQPPRLQMNEKPQSSVQRPIMSRDRRGQSESSPYAHDTGSLRSDLQYCAVDYRGRQKRWLPYYPPQEETISWKLTTSWNQHALPEEGKPCMPHDVGDPAAIRL